jgi:transcriptional regulator with XRE-family HTH domain
VREGLSLRELAKRIGCSATMLGEIERGKRLATNAQLTAISRELHMVFVLDRCGESGQPTLEVTLAVGPSNSRPGELSVRAWDERLARLSARAAGRRIGDMLEGLGAKVGDDVVLRCRLGRVVVK